MNRQIQTREKEIVRGSIAEVAAASGQSIAAAFMGVEAFVMVDVSGSMDMRDCPDGKSRYETAVEQLKYLQNEKPGKVAVGAFSGKAELAPSGVPFFHGSSTNMTAALNLMKMADATDIRLIVISDGQPDNEREAFEIARTFKSKIDTIYVGREGGSGSDFLRRLAELTGGRSITNETASLNLLSQNITRLLAA